jgi:hypothetical protein
MAITTNQSVLTLDYWKRAEHLEVGDWVFDQNGKPVQIKLVHKFFSEDCYEITFDDYLTVRGNINLAFHAENEKYRKQLLSCQMKTVRGFRRPLKFLPVSEILERGVIGRRGRKEFSIPTAKPLQFPAQTPGIPPFVFGFWFFNRKAKKKFSIHQDNKDFIIQKFKDAGYHLEFLTHIRGGYQYFYESPNIEFQLAPNIPTKIPTNYLLASEEERIELLSGLINAKPRQYDRRTNWFRITTGDFPTIQQIQGLAESLGLRTKVFYNEALRNYTIQFKSRHKLVHNQTSKPVKVHHARRYIKEITKIQPQMVIHIETTGKDNTILVGEGYIATC